MLSYESILINAERMHTMRLVGGNFKQSLTIDNLINFLKSESNGVPLLYQNK